MKERRAADNTPIEGQFSKSTIWWSSWLLPTSMLMSFNQARLWGKIVDSPSLVFPTNSVRFCLRKSETICHERVWHSCHSFWKSQESSKRNRKLYAWNPCISLSLWKISCSRVVLKLMDQLCPCFLPFLLHPEMRKARTWWNTFIQQRGKGTYEQLCTIIVDLMTLTTTSWRCIHSLKKSLILGDLGITSLKNRWM